MRRGRGEESCWGDCMEMVPGPENAGSSQARREGLSPLGSLLRAGSHNCRPGCSLLSALNLEIVSLLLWPLHHQGVFPHPHVFVPQISFRKVFSHNGFSVQ